MKVGESSRLWPPHCCVPAFVKAALRQLGVDCPGDEAFARFLGVRVAPGQENPFGLTFATETHPAGISAGDAERQINRLCRSLQVPIYFRHVPFRSIAFGLWEDVLQTARRSSAVVGVGVDYHQLEKIEPDRSALHVLRIVECRRNTVKLYDDSGESVPTCFEISHDRLERAVIAASDGYWILGSAECMSLPYVLPWSALP